MLPMRHQRVRELLKRTLAEILRREVDVSEYGLMNINEVGVGNDLKSATVFVGIVGSEAQRKKGTAKLQKDRGHFQQLMARELVLRYTPKIKFRVDDSIEQGNRVLEIIEELEGERE